MFLDAFKLHSLTVQIRYQPAYVLWDKAGAVARAHDGLWPGLTVPDANANQQVLRSKDVQIQTGLDQSTITLFGTKSYDAARTSKVKETYDVWWKELELSELTRVSSRAIYVKEFSTLKDANAELLGLNLVRWPTSKVFDQPVDGASNGPDIRFHFEDENSFTFLRLKAEKVNIEAEMHQELSDLEDIKLTKTRLVLDFDRGIIGKISAEKFRMEDWLKGHQHILRRDLEKVLRGAP